MDALVVSYRTQKAISCELIVHRRKAKTDDEGWVSMGTRLGFMLEGLTAAFQGMAVARTHSLPVALWLCGFLALCAFCPLFASRKSSCSLIPRSNSIQSSGTDPAKEKFPLQPRPFPALMPRHLRTSEAPYRKSQLLIQHSAHILCRAHKPRQLTRSPNTCRHIPPHGKNRLLAWLQCQWHLRATPILGL